MYLTLDEKVNKVKTLKEALGIKRYNVNKIDHIEEDGWEYNKWQIIIKTRYATISFEYKMGIGHKGAAPDFLTVLETLASDYVHEDERNDKDEWISNMEDLDIISHKDYLKYEGYFYACVKQSQDIDLLRFGDGWQDLVMEVVNS